MENDNSRWTKTELEIYILLLCANADSVESEEEMKLIRSKFPPSKFESVYAEFSKDSEEEGLKKIENDICFHEYSHKELSEIKRDMREVFYTDEKYTIMERKIGRILNKILY